MSQPERFEVLIVGSGQGGKLLAWHMAQSGLTPPHSELAIERRLIAPTIGFGHDRCGGTYQRRPMREHFPFRR
jgi:hypothetical protein